MVIIIFLLIFIAEVPTIFCPNPFESTSYGNDGKQKQDTELRRQGKTISTIENVNDDPDTKKFKDDVKKLNDQLEELIITGKDANEYALIALQTLVDKSADFVMTTDFVIGGLLKLVARGIPEPESQELKAIKALNKIMVREFNNFLDQIEDLLHNLNCEYYMSQYNENVNLPLKYLLITLNQLLDPDNISIFDENRRGFVQDCNGAEQTLAKVVIKVVEYIESHVDTNCQYPPKKSEPFLDADICEIPLVDRKDLPSLKISNENADISCYQEVVLAGNKHFSIFLLHFALRVQQNLVYSQLIGTYCVHFATDSEERKKEKLKSIQNTAIKTAKNMKKWIEKKLEIAWPEIIYTYAKKEIKHDIYYRSAQEYDEMAFKMARAALSRSDLSKYGYQVYIWHKTVNSWTSWRLHYAICKPEHDCVSAEWYNVIFTIYRFPANQLYVEKSKKIREWFYSNYDSINTALCDRTGGYDLPWDLSGVIDYIHEKTHILDHIQNLILISETHVMEAGIEKYTMGWNYAVQEKTINQYNLRFETVNCVKHWIFPIHKRFIKDLIVFI